MRHIDVIINVNIKFPEVPALKYTVLVVEDEINQRRALVERVEWEKAGFEVIGQAENGAEALDKVEQLEPDLIFTDIKMPLISGLELAAKVRELRPATQIVILSGYDSFEYARTAINYNIISYLLKPICPRNFRSSFSIFTDVWRKDSAAFRVRPRRRIPNA